VRWAKKNNLQTRKHGRYAARGGVRLRELEHGVGWPRKNEEEHRHDICISTMDVEHEYIVACEGNVSVPLRRKILDDRPA